MKLSILICSLVTRIDRRKELLWRLLLHIGAYQKELTRHNNYLIERYAGEGVEIIICTDHKKLSVGAKRNLLLDEAKGDYAVFIDDDDMVDSNYVEQLLIRINSFPAIAMPDVIVFDAVRYHNGKLDKPVSYGKEYSRDYSTRDKHYRLPNHLMCVKRNIALKVKFKNLSWGEDADYARRLLPHLKTQARINACLYTYFFDEKTTETAK